MKKKVVIACDEQGQYSVGEEAGEFPTEGVVAEGGAPAPAPEMKPAQSLDDALAQAKAMFEEVQTMDGGPSPFQRGFDKVNKGRGQPDMGGTAGGLGY